MGACSEEIDLNIVNPTLTISNPSITGLYALVSATASSYSSGDSFSYSAAPPNEDIGVDVVLVNGPTLFENATCDGASFIDDEFIECIAEGVMWLAFTVYTDGGPMETTPTRRDLSSSDYQFQYHLEWQPTGTCSTARCMAVAGAPLNTWIPLGNGTYNGKFYDLHFVHTGKVMGHRAWPGGFPNESSLANPLAGRQYQYVTLQYRYSQPA